MATSPLSKWPAFADMDAKVAALWRQAAASPISAIAPSAPIGLLCFLSGSGLRRRPRRRREQATVIRRNLSISTHS